MASDSGKVGSDQKVTNKTRSAHLEGNKAREFALVGGFQGLTPYSAGACLNHRYMNDKDISMGGVACERNDAVHPAASKVMEDFGTVISVGLKSI